MKKLYSYLFAFSVFATSFFVGCELDVKPTSTIGSESYWKNEKDAWSFLNSIYNNLVPGHKIHEESYSDNAYCQYSWESKGADFQQDQLSTADGAGWDFVGIQNVNEFLENVDRCNMKNEYKERMKAEARFLRAVDYLEKTIQVGKVPIITELLDPDTKNIPRNSVEEVRDFIISEFREVANILPDKYDGGYMNEKGRATRYAAIAYLSRAALLFGNYTLAESTASELMNSPFSLFTVSLLNDKQKQEAEEIEKYVDFASLGIDKDRFVKGIYSYEGLWLQANANPDNPEFIFTRQYAENIQETWSPFKAIRPSQLGGWSSVTPTQNLVNAYWTAEGKVATIYSVEERKDAYNIIDADLKAFLSDKANSFSEFCKTKLEDGSLMNYQFMKEFRNRDSRLYASILLPFKGWPETEYGTDFYYRWYKTAGNESRTGYNFRKMTPIDRTTNGAQNSAADYPNFRFAEVLLIFAEARTQNTGYDAVVQNALNQLRDRVGMPNVPTSFSSKQEALGYIRNERRIELACEGQRTMDMTRYEDTYWQNAMNNVSITMPDGAVLITMKWSTRMRLRPLSQTAMDRNPILKNDQNPGY